MNLAVQRLFEECLALVDGDKPSFYLMLTATLRGLQPAALARGTVSGPERTLFVIEDLEPSNVSGA